MAPEAKQKCFVIMPISKTSDKHTKEYWTNHYKTFIKPLIESRHPLRAKRSAPLRGDIVRQIITDLVTIPIVVADLTDANPNVYWELGVRQSFKHGTITIAEYGTDLPFDIGVKATLFYFPSDHLKMREFENEFHEAIDDCLNNPDLPDSHVLETISGRGTLYQILTRDEALRKLDAVISELKQNSFVLDLAARTCKENIQKRKQKSKKTNIVTGRFRCAAADVLVVNRYIDADEKFYHAAEDYVDYCRRANDQLSSWEYKENRESVESWFQNTQDGANSYFNTFRELVITHKKTLETTL